MSTPKYKPCDPMKRTLCPAMDARANAHVNKGLNYKTLVNMETLQPSRNLITYNDKKAPEKELCLNFCPWCGTKYDNESTLEKE